jgi:hypothetical protein
MNTPSLQSLAAFAAARLRVASGLLAVAALAVLLGSPSPAHAQWRSSLYPTNWAPPTTASFENAAMIQDFSYAGYRRGETDLPWVEGPIFNAVTGYGADPTGANDSTIAIQNAINAAASSGGGVVFLPAGTYKVQPQGADTYALRIDASRVVLRGAGSNSTFILNDSWEMRDKQIIRVTGSGWSWGTVPGGSPQPAITSDLLTPTRTIAVASTAGFSRGDWVIVRADATDPFATEHNMPEWHGHGASLGGVMFLRRIESVMSDAFVIDAPIRYYLKTRDNARVHLAVPHVEEVGLEHFSIGNREHPQGNRNNHWGATDYTDPKKHAHSVHNSWAIDVRRVRNSWVRDVKTYRPAVNSIDTHILSNGIRVLNCRFLTIQDADFQRPLYGGGGGNGYMYRLQSANEVLIEDSAARFNRHGFVISHMQSSGNVIRGGVAQDTRWQAAPGNVSGEGSDHHMHLSQSNLVDTVQLARDFFSAHFRGTAGTVAHGQTAAHSVFWNLEGAAYQSNKSYIIRTDQARHGYAIGTRGPAAGISTLASDASRTSPVDHVESEGQGATLQPFSLHLDQLSRRLQLPSPWATRDMGDVGTAGAVFRTSSGFRYFINGSGDGIGGTEDAFRYFYTRIGGDGSIEAQVVLLENRGPESAAGVLMRTSVLNANAPMVAMVLTPAGASFRYRTSAGGPTTTVTASGSVPRWVRLVRAGNTFTGEISTNGTNWTQVGSVNLSWSNTYLGKAVTSGVKGVFSEACFQYVSFTGGPVNPTNLTATAVSSGQIDLSWNDSSNNETQFRLERSTGGGAWDFLINKSANSTTHSDTTVAPQTAYSYRVRAENDNGVSNWSNTASAVTP